MEKLKKKKHLRKRNFYVTVTNTEIRKTGKMVRKVGKTCKILLVCLYNLQDYYFEWMIQQMAKFWLAYFKNRKSEIRIKNRQKFFKILLKSCLFAVEFKILWILKISEKVKNRKTGLKNRETGKRLSVYL